MAHGGSRSIRLGDQKWSAIVVLAILFLSLSGASGPTDDLGRIPAIYQKLTNRGVVSLPAHSMPLTAAPGARRDHSVGQSLTTTVRDSRGVTGSQAVRTPQAGPFNEDVPAITPELLHDESTAVEPPATAVPLPRKSRILTVEVTAYCACKKCCGSRAQGLTASGKHITYNGGHFIAADPKLLPYFTKVIVPGYNNGKPVDVIDRGGAIKGYHIDIFMPTHQQAVAWGKKWLQVTVFE